MIYLKLKYNNLIAFILYIQYINTWLQYHHKLLYVDK